MCERCVKLNETKEARERSRRERRRAWLCLMPSDVAKQTDRTKEGRRSRQREEDDLININIYLHTAVALKREHERYELQVGGERELALQ